MTISTPSRARRTRKTRAETSEAIRQSLFLAAAVVVGRHGYADASISRITQAAEVAHGTFYNHFESRQDLFEQLLPALGEMLLNHVTGAVASESSAPEREDARLKAWFSFLQEHPEFYRILNEGEVFVPEVFRQHVGRFGAGYLRTLRRAKERGELNDFTDEELEPVAYILLAARAYLTFRYGRSEDAAAPVPAPVFSAYRKLLKHGLFAADAAKPCPADKEG
ncbi:TetR/AcrR family transcriptional regulator [Azospirillum sp. HJ39]|uniref:TetR/AcrR family transcriptional regulator n=1 Tax=Azospirillum sp. HJ39 TaxID=3159496 RepID=UPI003558DA93